MKESDEWRNWWDRWMPTLMGTFMLLNVAFYLAIGASLWLIVFMLIAALFGFAVQLEYELKQGVLS